MSNSTNTELLERAAAMIDYFVGKMPAQVIEHDLEMNDMDALYEHVCDAEALAAREEFEAVDAY